MKYSDRIPFLTISTSEAIRFSEGYIGMNPGMNPNTPYVHREHLYFAGQDPSWISILQHHFDFSTLMFREIIQILKDTHAVKHCLEKEGFVNTIIEPISIPLDRESTTFGSGFRIWFMPEDYMEFKLTYGE
jgi:hypothetical protein